MNVALAIAALGWFVLAFGHTTIGRRQVLPNLTKEPWRAHRMVHPR
jgi:hypothetical protein